MIQSGDPDDLFAFSINYETVVNSLDGRVKPLYNGNISETFWKTSSDDTERSYGYQYDQLNRLNAALYQKSGQATMSYDEWMDYDKNGNIQHLSRNGAMDSQNQPQEIDVLEYTYHPQLKNQLMAVSDITGSPEGFKDGEGSQPLADDYVYDRNGNMVVDANKGITRITYNHINLPVKILFDSDLNKIEYLYTATGEKVQKTVTKNGTPVITTYLGGFQYKGKKLMFFPTAEGYVNYTTPTLSEDVFGSATPESFNYFYNYTDHLGNIRLSYTLNPSSEELTVIEENHYYPFGLKHSKYNSDWNAFLRFDEGIKLRPGRPLAPLEYKYKYNGKEFQDELGLNWYDMDARNYMSDIGRWGNMDALSETFVDLTPYNFSNNNPVSFSDPSGLAPQEGVRNVGIVNRDVDYYASTFVNSRRKVVEHRNDGDNNIYEVDDNWKPGGSKKGLAILGKEIAGEMYNVGYNVSFYNGFGVAWNGNHTITPVGGLFDVTGAWEAFFTELFSESDSEGAMLAMAVITKGKVSPKWSIRALNGLFIKGFGKHSLNRAIGDFTRKGVKPSDILDALKKPLLVKDIITDGLGRQSQRFIGRYGEVVVNPSTGLIISVNPTSTHKAIKLINKLNTP